MSLFIKCDVYNIIICNAQSFVEFISGDDTTDDSDLMNGRFMNESGLFTLCTIIFIEFISGDDMQTTDDSDLMNGRFMNESGLFTLCTIIILHPS